VNLRRLSEAFGVEWSCQQIVPRIVDMHTDANYLHRLTSLYAVKTLADVLTPEAVQEFLIPLTISLAKVRRMTS
jgi:serine/threonine-protein phosphatase 2A regulatory subunit A